MLGTHELVDFWGCRDLSIDQWRELLKRAVDASGTTLVDLRIEPFQPQGLTAFCLLAESHLAVHTWPEEDYIAIDLFTCGDSVSPDRAIDVLMAELEPEKIARETKQRGVLSRAGGASERNPKSKSGAVG